MIIINCLLIFWAPRLKQPRGPSAADMGWSDFLLRFAIVVWGERGGGSC